MTYHVIIDGRGDPIARTRYYEDSEAVLGRYQAGIIVRTEDAKIVYHKREVHA